VHGDDALHEVRVVKHACSETQREHHHRVPVRYVHSSSPSWS
jgi:hypothetical protein